ncbi:MAG: hypothetical protein QM831_04975 [Kofleriaceae bacterium]
MSRNRELEAAILADRDARAPYEVYADWLLHEGDLRGELIHVQLALEANQTPALVAREQELLGTLDLADASMLKWLTREPRWQWRRGFLDAITVPHCYQDTETAYAYRHLADQPVAAVMREVTLGTGVFHHSYTGADDVSILEALRDAPLPIERLTFSSFDNDISWTRMGALAIAQLQGVKFLQIEAGVFSLGEVDLPELRSFAMITGGLRAQVLHELVAATWPALTSLTVYLGVEDYGLDFTVDECVKILDRGTFPKLDTLGVCNANDTDELVRAVASSKLMKRVKTLDLSNGTMSERGARWMMAHAGAFAHLDKIDLAGNFLGREIRAELRATLPSCVADHQRDERDGERYPVVTD